MKKILKLFFMAVLIILILSIIIYVKTIDTQYAIKYAQVFGSYNIQVVDKYLSEDTKITYMGKTDTYKNLRKNVVDAFEKREYKMEKGYSYGHGDDIFNNGIQSVDIQSYVICENYKSNYVLMKIKRNCLISYKIDSISSEDDFFGYLFWGIEK